MGIFGSNTMSFLGGVAEGAQKEIARQQSTIDALIKDASQVIMADRLATRKRKQTRMSELGDKYNVLKNKKLSDSAIKVILEQDLYDDVIKISKKVKPGALQSFIDVVDGTDVNMNKSSLLQYLTRDIVDTDLSGMKFTGGGVDTLAALGLRKPVGKTITDRVDFLTPKTTIDVDGTLADVSGGFNERARRALDTSTKRSPASFNRYAAQTIAKLRGHDLKYVSSGTGAGEFEVQTSIQNRDLLNEILEEASELSKKYENIVFKDFTMSAEEAAHHLIFGTTQKYAKTNNTNNINTSAMPFAFQQKINQTKNLSKQPKLVVPSSTTVLNSLDAEIAKQLKKGVTKFPVNLKQSYITQITQEIRKNDSSISIPQARAMAQAQVRNILKKANLQ